MTGIDPTAQPVTPDLPGPDARAPRALGETPATDPRRARQAARDFESVFIHRVMEAMRRTVPKGGLLSSGASEQMEGLFWMYLSREVAAKGGFGLWKELARRVEAFGEAAAGEAPGAAGGEALGEVKA